LRLVEADLAFGELLPEKPGWMEQDEYEQRTASHFDMRELSRSIRELRYSPFASHAHGAELISPDFADASFDNLKTGRQPA